MEEVLVERRVEGGFKWSSQRVVGEREKIAILNAGDCGVREIARRIGRSPSTISREMRRNAATRSGGFEYRATTAQWHADRRARRPKTAKLAANPRLCGYVQERHRPATTKTATSVEQLVVGLAPILSRSEPKEHEPANPSPLRHDWS